MSAISSSHFPWPGERCPETWDPGTFFPTAALLFHVSQVHFVILWLDTQTEVAARYRIHAYTELGHFTPDGQLQVMARKTEKEGLFLGTLIS